jgi:hypothetical protein
MANTLRSSVLRALAWLTGTVAVVAAAAYAIGGRQLFRNLLRARSRAAAFLQPPTQDELQRATASNPASTTSVSALQTVPSVTIGHIVIWVAAILVIIVVLFYVTGRPRKQRTPLAGR